MIVCPSCENSAFFDAYRVYRSENRSYNGSMQTLVLKFLGTPRFERDTIPISVVRAKGVALLLYLAIRREAQPRDQVMDLLWPESLPQAARKNMRNTLWSIREALGTEVVTQEGGLLRLSPAVIVDIHLLEDGARAMATAPLHALVATVTSYRGPLADGLDVREVSDFDVWLHTERVRLAALAVQLWERVIAHDRALEAWGDVVAHASSALRVDPTCESIHLALIEAAVRLHQRGRAVQQYETLTEILQRELQTTPLPETRARYEALLHERAGSRSPHPAARPAAPAPFIGREAELAALERAQARALAGDAQVLLITGDLGLGKTRLWQRWLELRPDTDSVLVTHALEMADPLPFGPLLPLFRHGGPAHACVHPPSSLAPIWLAELSRLLPELRQAWPQLAPPLHVPPAEERARLLHALTEAMRLLAAPLLVLIIDDLHWADPSTLDWIVTLVDQLSGVLLIGTARPQDTPERLRRTVATWQRHGRLTHLPLAQLSADESRRLLAALGVAAIGAQEQEWVDQSGGNPYYLLELQRAGGSASARDLMALLRTRLQAIIPVQATPVLQAAAVLGDSISFALLQATAGCSEEEALVALDLLLTAGVLTTDGCSYRLTHPLVGTVVRQALSPARRAVFHRRAAAALERAHAAAINQVAGLLMEHYAEAEDLPRAAAYAEQAARHALQVGAFTEASSYARQACGWAPTAQRTFVLGQAVLFAGSTGEAQQLLAEAVAAGDDGNDGESVARACLILAIVAVSMGQADVARRWLAHPVLHQGEPLPPALVIEMLQITAFVERQCEAYDVAEALLSKAEQYAQQHQLPQLDRQVAFERGNVRANRGDLPGALDLYARTLRLAEEAADPVFAVMAHNNLAYHTLLLGDIAGARQHAAAAVAVSERVALNLLWQYIWSTLGEIALADGALDQADSAFAQAFASASAQGNRSQMANVRANQARVACAHMRWEQAQQLVDEAAALLVGERDPAVRNKIAQIAADLQRRSMGTS